MGTEDQSLRRHRTTPGDLPAELGAKRGKAGSGEPGGNPMADGRSSGDPGVGAGGGPNNRVMAGVSTRACDGRGGNCCRAG